MTTIHLTCDPGGHRARLRTTLTHLRPMTLTADATSARVALVPTTALLLAGDNVRVEVDVGPGTSLEVVETSGTVAYDMRGAAATWTLHARIAESASLVWQGQPFVAAAGSDVRRTTRLDLAPGARLLLRDTLVLGRTSEPPGRVTSRMDTPVLVEELDPDVLPCRVLDSILAVGQPAQPGGMTLESGDQLYRSLAEQTHLTGLDAVWQTLRSAAGDGSAQDQAGGSGPPEGTGRLHELVT